MKTLMPLLLILGMVGCGGDPNEKANELFVESVRLINSAKNKTGDAAIADYEQSLENVQQIIDEYSKSDLAVRLVSGETLFSNESLSDIRARLGELKEKAKRERSTPDPIAMPVGAEKVDPFLPAKPVTSQDESVLTVKGHSGWLRSVSFSPDGKQIVSGGGVFFKPGEINVWDAQTG